MMVLRFSMNYLIIIKSLNIEVLYYRFRLSLTTVLGAKSTAIVNTAMNKIFEKRRTK
jgi:hypothetical protein